jgi:hypothetical protein
MANDTIVYYTPDYRFPPTCVGFIIKRDADGTETTLHRIGVDEGTKIPGCDFDEVFETKQGATLFANLVMSLGATGVIDYEEFEDDQIHDINSYLDALIGAY